MLFDKGISLEMMMNTIAEKGFSGKPCRVCAFAGYAVCYIFMLAGMAGGGQDRPMQTLWRFDFGNGSVSQGWSQVQPDNKFMPGVDFGFIDNEGVLQHSYEQGDDLTCDLCYSVKPFYFTVRVAQEGNYRVRAILGDIRGESQTSVKAESRRLMLYNVKTKSGEIVTKEFIVNVRNSLLPGGDRVRLKSRESGVWHWDDELTLEFNGERTSLCALEIEYVPGIPTIFLAGDSTVTDQPAEPWTSWGQMLTLLFKPEIAIANYAESGETLAAFTAEKRFAKIFSQMKKGDYLFIQFAHNDMKRGTPEQTGYSEALKHVIRQTRDLGASPVLVTSMHRRSFDDNGKVRDTMQGYPEAMKAVAMSENVALLDLHAMSRELYEALGPDRSAIAFQDGTHHNAYGAYEIARCLALAISQEMPELKSYLADGAAAFRPAVPDDNAVLAFPVSVRSSVEKPEGD